MKPKININKNKSVPSGYVISLKNRRIGCFLIIAPIIGLILILLFYSIMVFGGNHVGTDTETVFTTIRIINMVLTLLGTLCVIGIIIGIPLGILYYGKKELIDGVKYDERSGKKEASIVPDEIKGWNWGAAGLTWIWGIYHGVWISLLIFIPLVNIGVLFVLGIKGSEWAWQAQKWESVESFMVAQKKWRFWGIVFFVLIILGFLSNFLDLES